MKSVFKLLGFVLTMVLLGGCATSLVSDVDPQADLSTLQRFYVVKLPSDKRGVQDLIVDELRSMGKEAESGVESRAPMPVDAVITYEDKWMWDITMYMLELRIGIRDPETNYKFASGYSYRTSMARKPPEEMVTEVLGEIFGNDKGE